TRTDDKRGIRGGPIPPGLYECVYISNHHKFHECIFLKQTLSSKKIYTPFANHPIPHSRGSFYIHGRGRHGSDGCIVPENPTERMRLNAALRENPHTTLNVIHAAYELPAELLTPDRIV